MQLTLNVLFFFLGFVVAGIVGSKPKQTRSTLADLVGKFRYITKGLAPCASGKDIPIRDQLETGNVKLLTKWGEQHVSNLKDRANRFCRAECEKLSEESWQRQAYEEVKSILLARSPGAKKFPCIYATKGYRHNEHRYIFMHSENPTEPRNIRLLANAMRAYLPESLSLGPNTSLVIIHPRSKEEYSVESYQQKFWDLLRGLRTCDQRDWPSDIPAETDAPKWAFCFDGAPWFPAAMTPAHEQRQTRHAPNFIIAMQPKWVFDNLFRTPEMRRASVEAVRKLMPAYDAIEPSPDLSAYGTEGTTEAHQYYLLDENKTSNCPYIDLDR